MLVAISYPGSFLSFCNIFQSLNNNPKSSIRQQIQLRCRRRVVGSLPDPTEGAKVEYTPWLIAGLGNPGNKYHGTRHNVGFEMVDCIARAEGIRLSTIQSKALFGFGSFGKVPILLVKPQAYMNFTGESIGPLAAYYQVPLRHILLIYDEMSLPNGVLRLSPKGGHGHHNGVKSVIGHLDGCRDFPRLCIGVGNPPGKMDLRAFLLQKFSSEEREQVVDVASSRPRVKSARASHVICKDKTRLPARATVLCSRSRPSLLLAISSSLLLERSSSLLLKRSSSLLFLNDSV